MLDSLTDTAINSAKSNASDSGSSRGSSKGLFGRGSGDAHFFEEDYFLDISAILLNANGSLTASSANIFRSRLTLAFLSPAISLL